MMMMMMMKISLIYFGLALVSRTYAQFVCNSVNGYSVKDLTSASEWETQTDYNCLTNAGTDCSFHISFCQTAHSCYNQYSACQNASGASNLTIIGAYSTNVFKEYTNGTEGFYAQFPAGPLQVISNTTNCTPSLIIQFNCNPKVKWLVPITNGTASAPEPTDVDLDGCTTIMKFDYDGACRKNETPAAGIGGGAVFLIILFSVALAYFGFGMLYNGCLQHKSGINILPNTQFWIGLPLHAIEGFRTIITCAICEAKPSQATYQSV